MSLDFGVIIGCPANRAVGFAGAQVFGIMGTHGTGGGADKACAAITAGFSMLLQKPKGKIFVNGRKSKMVAAGKPSNVLGVVGITFNGETTVPKLHFKHLPTQTLSDIIAQLIITLLNILI